MRSTIIVPEEAPPTIEEIKRALLTYEKVYLIDPTDRDTIPPTSLMYSMGMPPIMSMNMGAVAPLVKTPRYDDVFDQVISEAKSAIKSGTVELTRTYSEISPNSLIIGNIGIKDYPLDLK